MCFVWISEQTAIISLYSINWLVCITETECLLCGTDWKFQYNSCQSYTSDVRPPTARQHIAGPAALHFYTVYLHTYHSVRQACQLSTALSHRPFSLSFPVPSQIPRNKSFFHKLSHAGAQELPPVCTNKILITVFTEPVTNVACSVANARSGS
jgi:hypothetical protein